MKNLLTFLYSCFDLDNLKYEFIPLHTKNKLKAFLQCKNFFANYQKIKDDFYFYTQKSNYNFYGGFCYKLQKSNKNTYFLVCQNINNFYEV